MEPDAQVSKKKKIVNEDDNLADNPHPSPDWLSLQNDVLRKIFDHLSIPDLFAFSSVCSNLCSLTPRSNCLLGPPLPRIYGTLVLSSMRCLKTLTPYPCPLRSMISTRTLNTSLYGNSYGHLIFITSVVIIANVFTGKQIRSPKLPYCEYHSMHNLATLTSNPSGSSPCFLVYAKSNWRAKVTDTQGKWRLMMTHLFAA